jgi:DNA-binding HxlR family transcriptional regulator
VIEYRVAGRRNYNQDCPIANGLDVRGERWTLLIVRELVGGPRRYSDLRACRPVSRSVRATSSEMAEPGMCV